ncbi:hypothetical protein PUN28_005542 [Cardiocondyla obscurior]|uniref:Uncharacterized protein n=1 Tax=Cardiocondyla obscurior TaxID=286306 RepID=A0AAW2GH24_9HYME
MQFLSEICQRKLHVLLSLARTMTISLTERTSRKYYKYSWKNERDIKRKSLGIIMLALIEVGSSCDCDSTAFVCPACELLSQQIKEFKAELSSIVVNKRSLRCTVIFTQIANKEQDAFVLPYMHAYLHERGLPVRIRNRTCPHVANCGHLGG